MEVTCALLHQDLTWSKLTWARCFVAKFRRSKKERGMKLQGKMEMKNPHAPLLLIPLRIRVFYSQRSTTHPNRWQEHHHSSTQLGCQARTEPEPVAGSKPTQSSVLWGYQCSSEAAFSNECSVGLDRMEQGRTRMGRWVSLKKREQVLHWFSWSGIKNYWTHQSHDLANQLAMKCDGECSLSWLANMWQPLAILSRPECYLRLIEKISFFMQRHTDPGPAAQHGTVGRTQERSHALYHLQIASVDTVITWSIYLAGATENAIILRWIISFIKISLYFWKS